jgi:hypothetical protein
MIVSLRKFPDALHRKAKAAAALEGISLTSFIARAVEAAVGADAPAKPTAPARVPGRVFPGAPRA